MCDEGEDDARWSEVHDVWDHRPLLDRAFERLLCIAERIRKPRVKARRSARAKHEAPATHR